MSTELREQVARLLSAQNWADASRQMNPQDFWLKKADTLLPLFASHECAAAEEQIEVDALIVKSLQLTLDDMGYEQIVIAEAIRAQLEEEEA